MSLVSGPGRGGITDARLPQELRLFVDKHVSYIQSLDTVRERAGLPRRPRSPVADLTAAQRRAGILAY